MFGLDKLDTTFIVWAFFLQISLVIHFAIRKILFETYTLRYGWWIYALAIPAVIISLFIIRGGKTWSFWLGGFLFLIFAVFGYWIDYHLGINWRNPLRMDIMFPYVILYLSSIMFYWWPLAMLFKPLWYVFGVLFIIGIVFNVTSH